MSNTSFNLAEFESLMALDNPIKSSKATRWERKGAQQPLDRFIPNRSAMEKNDENFDRVDAVSDNDHAKLMLGNNSESTGSRVLAFRNKAPEVLADYQNTLKVLYSAQPSKKSETVKVTRTIPSAPVRVLDAPDMLDDYYLNLLSWGSNNTLAVALSQSLYLWNASTGAINELMHLPETGSDYVSSVAWIQEGNHIAIGTAESGVQLWDVQAGRQVRSLGGHSARVGALAWNAHLLATGSRDNAVLNHDVRVQNHIVGKMTAHTQEVCGLAWSPDGTYLASGANDNTLCITEGANFHGASVAPKHVLTEHQAAVKALAWSPHERNLLASGGGTADRCIKFWNAASGSLVNSIDTGSQVCALQWSPFEKEILSSHGYSENQLCLWKYPSMAKIKELRGHTSRVLQMALSPEGAMVCTGAADETLRFWNVFAAEGKRKHDSVLAGAGALSGASSMKIR